MTQPQTINQNTKHNFLQKKDSRKRKVDLTLPIILAITPIDGSCYRVNDSSILKAFFSCVSKFLSCYEEKTDEKR